MSAKDISMMLALRKNARRELRVRIDTYMGHKLVNLRVWFRSDAGDMRPTQKGVAMQVSSLPAIIGALRRLEASIEEEGRACI